VDRRDRLLSMIDTTTARGVEIGPSFSPIVTKASGVDVTVVDHMDAEGLREKYRVHGVDLDAIEEVDVLWHGGSLVDALADRAPFDFILASHVLEHIPDPIGFLVDCEKLLVPGGVLSLALPDSRYCFDCLRPLTSIGQWVDAHFTGRMQHSVGTVLDHTLHASKRGAITWHAGATEPLAMVHQRDHVDEMLARSGSGDDYVDVHAWVFTPASFRYLVEMSAALGYSSLVVAEHHDTVGFEFSVSLQRPLAEMAPEQRTRAFDERLGTMATMAGVPVTVVVEPPPARDWWSRLKRGVRALQ
jgi:predicted SAM-dependent methyltransferase